MGNCSSYDKIKSVDSSLAVEILAKSEQNQVVVPSNISHNVFIQAAADNNDINEETLDGKNATHATTLAVFQRKSCGLEASLKSLVITPSEKDQSKQVESAMIAELHARAKRARGRSPIA